MSDWACAQEGTRLDGDSVFLLEFNKRFNVTHEGSNSSTGADFEIIIDDVRNHCFDVFKMEGTSTGQPKIDFLHTEIFHEGQQFEFLLDGRVTRTGAL